MDSTLKIVRETEFYQGYIRFKMAVTNYSPYVVTDVTLDFIYDDELLRVDTCEPAYLIKNGKHNLGSIDGNKSKSIAIYFDPLMCSKGTDINCHITYKDYQGKLKITQMDPKEISVVCPIMNTDSDINIGRLKEFIETLPHKDNRIYEIQSGFDIDKLAILAREVVEKRDVRHVRTLHTRDGKTCEIWYYGKTKVTKDDIVIKVSILTEHHTVELFTATQTAEALTGLLAEVGREIKDTVELKVSGKGRVINVSINKSKIDRSNLIDLCNMDGTCDVNVVVDKSEIDRSSIGSGNGDGSNVNQGDSSASVGNRECPVCFNVIDSSNKSLICKCGARFCQTCESWYREERKRGERPLCKSCFTAEQERLAREETARLKAAGEAEERKRLDQEELERLREEAEKKKPGASIKNSIGMELVLIPAGEFQMGSNEYGHAKPIHKVKISKPFYFGKYPVTQREWQAVMGSNPSNFKGDNNPVECVSWDTVQKFIKKLNEMEGTDKYRLPSEAEWEYACRAGTTTRYFFGDDKSKLGEYAWYKDNSGNKTHPVGQKKPNLWGLHDMYGNVEEWCQDIWSANYKSAPVNGSAWEYGNGSNRVQRGYSWKSYAGFLDRGWSAHRCNFDPTYNCEDFGFRLLREV